MAFWEGDSTLFLLAVKWRTAKFVRFLELAVVPLAVAVGCSLVGELSLGALHEFLSLLAVADFALKGRNVSVAKIFCACSIRILSKTYSLVIVVKSAANFLAIAALTIDFASTVLVISLNLALNAVVSAAVAVIVLLIHVKDVLTRVARSATRVARVAGSRARSRSAVSVFAVLVAVAVVVSLALRVAL
jgi:hypothetical protein